MKFILYGTTVIEVKTIVSADSLEEAMDTSEDRIYVGDFEKEMKNNWVRNFNLDVPKINITNGERYFTMREKLKRTKLKVLDFIKKNKL